MLPINPSKYLGFDSLPLPCVRHRYFVFSCCISSRFIRQYMTRAVRMIKVQVFGKSLLRCLGWKKCVIRCAGREKNVFRCSGREVCAQVCRKGKECT